MRRHIHGPRLGQFVKLVLVSALIGGISTAAIGLALQTSLPLSRVSLWQGVLAGKAIAAPAEASAAEAPPASAGGLTGVTNPFLGPQLIADMVERLSPTVVHVTARTQVQATRDPAFDNPFFRDFFGPRFPDIPEVPRTTEGLGTGVIIRPDGFIVTNQHVIDGATDIQVRLADGDKVYKAEVAGQDRETDLALLKIDAGRSLPVAPLGDSKAVRVGEWVVAIGNPYGLDHTVTVGVISAKGRPLTIKGRTFKNLVQTDAAINPGNSGGPLLNLQGEIIGINAAVNAEAQGIGFAIPADTVKGIIGDLQAVGRVKRPYLGVFMNDMNQDLARYLGLKQKEGVVIVQVTAGSPAEKAGLRRGDVILEIDRAPVKNSDDLKERVRTAGIGKDILLWVFRDGNYHYLTATLGEQPAEPPAR